MLRYRPSICRCRSCMLGCQPPIRRRQSYILVVGFYSQTRMLYALVLVPYPADNEAAFLGGGSLLAGGEVVCLDVCLVSCKNFYNGKNLSHSRIHCNSKSIGFFIHQKKSAHGSDFLQKSHAGSFFNKKRTVFRQSSFQAIFNAVQFSSSHFLAFALV